MSMKRLDGKIELEKSMEQCQKISEDNYHLGNMYPLKDGEEIDLSQLTISSKSMSKPLINCYDGLSEEYLNSLSKDDLVNILLIIITVNPVNSGEYYPTDCYLPDTLADIIRKRHVRTT